MTEKEFAFHGLLSEGQGWDDKKRKNVAMEIVAALENEAVIDWEIKPSVQKGIRRQIKGLLRVGGMEDDEIEAVLTKLLDLARTKFRTKQ